MEKAYDEGSPGIKSSESKDCGLEYHGAGGKTETDKGVLDSGNGIIVDDDLCFIKVFTQLLLKRENGAWRRHGQRDRAG